jgi:F420-dependent oxidoreductase-like protein
MRIGIVLDNTLALDDQLGQIVQAEQDGFDSCWLLHFAQFGYDALTLIALAGRRTARIELGTAVVPVYPFQPQALAGHALTAQAACGGRLTLGLGASHRPVVENVLGLSYDRPARYMREYLMVLQALIQDGQADFSGDIFRVKASLRVPGATPCPVMIAALAPAMLRLAGELTDGTITWMAGPRALATHIIPRIQEAAAAARRPPARVCAALPIAVSDDPNAARAHAAQRFQNYGQMPNYRRLLDIEGAAGPEGVAIVGDETHVEQQIRELARIGVTDFAALIFPATGDPPSSLARTQALLKRLGGAVA